MPIQQFLHIQRYMLRGAPDTLWVFGDNLARYGLAGQAAEMRGEPNTIGLPTKRGPWGNGYLTDSDLVKVIEATAKDIYRMRRHLQNHGTVVWPKAGIGTGFAKLASKAPRIAQFYAETLAELIAIDGRI